MPWHKKYWDIFTQLYWEPGHLGLASIPKKYWGDHPDQITIPRNLVQNGGSLYARRGTAAYNLDHAKALEETLNHVFDITFGIAPDQVISELFHDRLRIADTGPFERLGREVSSRYNWAANVTQQDGFFVSDHSLVGIELKLGAPTSAIQVLKYLALMVCEEKSSRRLNRELGLIFITPALSDEAISQQCGSNAGHLPDGFLTSIDSAKLNKTMRELTSTHRVEFQAAARRLKIGHVSWRQMVVSCQAIVGRLNADEPGDETLARLLTGFSDAILGHSGVGIAQST